MGSNHPWKNKIAVQVGETPERRRHSLRQHYENVRAVLGPYFWGGSQGYVPELDPFYRRLITQINNRTRP